MTEPIDARNLTDAEYAVARRAVIHEGLVEARAKASAAEMLRLEQRYPAVENKS